jgi:ribonucleoside-diphosphate reductase alpha chain
VVSKGFMRGNLRLAASGGRGHHAETSTAVSVLQDELAAAYPISEGATALFTSDGATALKADTEVMYRRTTVSETQVVKQRSSTDRIAEARLRGYEGVSCPECANFTMVRNGTCLKCDTCGSTSGCS